MKNIFLSVLLVLGLGQAVNAQIADGSTAPDFTLTDRDGVEHNLYTYLNQGKAVYLKFFACHCPSCWAYHNTHKLDSLYDMYGPNGTDEVMVLMLEHDQNNPDAFTGVGTGTQGDWTLDNSVPMIDVEGTEDRTVFTDYNMVYYPMIFKVCPDKKTKLMSTSFSVAQLYQEANDCPGNLSVEGNEVVGKAFYDQINHQLKWAGFQNVKNISVYNLMGQKTLDVQSFMDGSADLSALENGMYILNIQYAGGTFSKKILVQQ